MAFVYAVRCNFTKPEAEAQAELARLRPHRPGMLWLEAVGLDRQSPFLGLSRIPRGSTPAPLPEAGPARETLFAPRFPFARAPQVAM